MSEALLDLIDQNPALIAEYRRFLVKTMIDLQDEQLVVAKKPKKTV
jgi:hypothetical protein